METRSSHNWKCRAGSQDYLNDSNLFEIDLPKGMPKILDLPQKDIDTNIFTPFHAFKKGQTSPVHFFIDDHLQNKFWNQPMRYIRKLQTSIALSTPDFSPYSDYPEALQIFNIYRSRYLTRLMQEEGLNVFPFINFNGENTYEYAFCGLPKGKITMCASQGRTNDMSGFKELLRVCEPSKIYCYGSKHKKDLDLLHNNIVYCPTFWELKRVKNRIIQ